MLAFKSHPGVPVLGVGQHLDCIEDICLHKATREGESGWDLYLMERVHIHSTTPSLGEWIHMVIEEIYEDRKRASWKGLALGLTSMNTVTACSKAALPEVSCPRHGKNKGNSMAR